MAHGEAIVIGVRLEADAPIVGRRLSEIAAEYEPEWEFMVGSISRGEYTYIPRTDYTLMEGRPGAGGVQAPGPEPGGQAPRPGHRDGPPRAAARRGAAPPRSWRPGWSPGEWRVVVVERDPERALELAEDLADVQVFEGDITDADLLEETDLGRFDAVAALTGEDESNILALPLRQVGGRLPRRSRWCTSWPCCRCSTRPASMWPLSPPHRHRRRRDALRAGRRGRGGHLPAVRRRGARARSGLGQSGRQLPGEGSQTAQGGSSSAPSCATASRRSPAARSRLRGRDHVVAFATPDSVLEVNRLLACET